MNGFKLPDLEPLFWLAMVGLFTMFGGTVFLICWIIWFAVNHIRIV